MPPRGSRSFLASFAFPIFTALIAVVGCDSDSGPTCLAPDQFPCSPFGGQCLSVNAEWSFESNDSSDIDLTLFLPDGQRVGVGFLDDAPTIGNCTHDGDDTGVIPPGLPPDAPIGPYHENVTCTPLVDAGAYKVELANKDVIQIGQTLVRVNINKDGVVTCQDVQIDERGGANTNPMIDITYP